MVYMVKGCGLQGSSFFLTFLTGQSTINFHINDVQALYACWLVCFRLFVCFIC